MMEATNEGLTATISCSHCGHEFQVALLQISKHEKVKCPSCGKDNDLSRYDEEAEKTARKNQKELDKLKKLRKGS